VDFAPGTNPRSRADIVFTRHRLVVFLDGCFWHGCDVHYSAPVAHRGFWAAKVTANRDRDARTTAALTRDGWRVLRFWEHEKVEDVVDGIERALGVESSLQER
jgi:DNA mismatch endonuclease (patch repair protein)